MFEGAPPPPPSLLHPPLKSVSDTTFSFCLHNTGSRVRIHTTSNTCNCLKKHVCACLALQPEPYTVHTSIKISRRPFKAYPVHAILSSFLVEHWSGIFQIARYYPAAFPLIYTQKDGGMILYDGMAVVAPVLRLAMTCKLLVM